MLGNIVLSLWLGSSSVNYASQAESRQSYSLPRTETSASTPVYLSSQETGHQKTMPEKKRETHPRQAGLWIRDDAYDTLECSECSENSNNKNENSYQKSVSEPIISANSPLFDRRILR